MSIEKYIADIIKREGGFVDHKLDKGGATKYGITLQTLRDWRKEDVTKEDVTNLRVEEAYKIYRQNYLLKPGLHNIHDIKLQALMLDTAVHSGVTQAIKFLQQLLGIKTDGIIGAVTIRSVNNVGDRLTLRKQYLSERIRFLGRIISRDNSQAVFASGWLNRIGDLLEELV